MRLTLSSVIYPPECLRETVAAYAALCSVNVFRELGESYSIEICGSADIDEGRLKNEFLNYLLALSAERYLEKA